MRIIKILKNRFVRCFDKTLNTLIWLFTPKDKVLVLNVWSKHRGSRVLPYNFGDDINYDLATFLSKKKVISYKYSYISIFRPTNYMCIGSIVDYMTNDKSIIWGSGALFGDKDIIAKPLKVCAVRGPLTRDYLQKQGVSCPEIYGDPALLLPILYKPVKRKRYKIGIIPHIVDINTPSLCAFKEGMSDDVAFINLRLYKKWQDIIDQICDCEIIASSSLHGLIIADAYNIPNVWIKLSDSIIGDDFKYRDYFGSCGRKYSAPISFENRAIDVKEIIDEGKNWAPILFQKNALIESCPFIYK